MDAISAESDSLLIGRILNLHVSIPIALPRFESGHGRAEQLVGMRYVRTDPFDRRNMPAASIGGPPVVLRLRGARAAGGKAGSSIDVKHLPWNFEDLSVYSMDENKFGVNVRGPLGKLFTLIQILKRLSES